MCKDLARVLRLFPGEKFALLQGQEHELHEFSRRPRENPLEIIVCFEGSEPRGGSLWWIHLGAKLEQPGAGRSATYFVAIGTKGEETGCVSDTLSKVHWDYAFSGQPNCERKPERHLQFGGGIHDRLSKFGYTPAWVAGMDKPRVPCLPICFVTLLHWAFLEFEHCEHIRKVLNEDWWTNLVRTAEEETIKEFVNSASEFFRTQKGSFLSKGYH